MKKRDFLTQAVVAGALIFFHTPFSAADTEKRFVLVSPLVIDGLNAEESRIIENLIYSYINTLGDVFMLPGTANGVGSPPGFQGGRIPDYTFSGRITRNEDGLMLTLEVGESRTGERASLTSVYKTVAELALNARSRVEAAFVGRFPQAGEPAGGALLPERTGEVLTEGSIIGTWKGEPGIAVVRLRRGGRGLAVFSSGAQMNLLYSIENNALQVVQDSPNTEQYYQRQGNRSAAIPYLVARRLAEEAKPMRWELFLYENGTVLRGIKTASVIHYDLERILQVTHGTIQEVEWIRSGH
ncbi:MAG: hypothetical protein LBE17_09915 [Treponema sp.]|jgi:hypothetical protein|nr:hypothetical protein [Treponema sp.]